MRRHTILFASSVAWASAAGYDPTEVLSRAMQKALDRAKTIPRYTCVETVTRDYFEPLTAALPRDCSVLLEQRRRPTPDILLRPYSTDRLRLDVTMSSQGEIFSWLGATRFEDKEIDKVVRNGPMGTGSFGGFLSTIFSSDVRKFIYERSLSENGRLRLEYSFQVTQPDSHYKVKLNDSWVFVPYSGVFQVEPETGDVVSMRITTGESPLATGVCQVTTTMDFAKVRIGSEQFMLPRQARQRFIYPQVQEAENTTVFTNCREFRGESTVTFSPAEPAETAGAKAASVPPASLPRGLAFSFALIAAIPTATAAAGDPFTAKLTDALRDERRKVIAPKGALVEGRLLRVQSYTTPPEVIVVFKPESVRVRDSHIALNAVRDWTYLVAQRRRLGKGVEILVPLRGEDSSGVFRFAGEHIVVPAGFQSDWKTVK